MRQLQEHSWMPLSPRQTQVRDLYLPSLHPESLGCCSRCLSPEPQRAPEPQLNTSPPLLPQTDLWVCGSGNTDGGVIAASSSDTSMLESCDAACWNSTRVRTRGGSRSTLRARQLLSGDVLSRTVRCDREVPVFLTVPRWDRDRLR